jgi:hypothetical protein
MPKMGEKQFEFEWLSKLLGPTRHIAGSSISYTGGTWTVVDQSGAIRYAKGVMTTSGATGGELNVHLVNDFNASGTKVYCPLPLGTNDVKAAVFDEIKQAGTTISLSDVIICID